MSCQKVERSMCGLERIQHYPFLSPSLSLSLLSFSPAPLILPGGFHQFVPPEGYEGGGGISPLTPPFIVGPHGHPLMEGLEVPPEFMPALGIALDSRVRPAL